MASSDEESEISPVWVSDYELFNRNDHHVSFECLPRIQCKDEISDMNDDHIFLSGTYNDGLVKFYKQVISWRYELSFVQPEIWLLCKGNSWIKLLKPKRVYESEIRSILITIHCLYFVKHNPEAPKESVWSHLSRIFSECSEADCENHISLIRDAVENDKDLATSKYMLGILSEQPGERITPHMAGLPVTRDRFVVDEVEDDFSQLDELCEEEELFDTCCSLCDNGGKIVCCEGRCMRSFHATIESGQGLCETLGLSEAYVNAIPNFFCKNCQYQQHQCFICGKLGSSDTSSNTEVFPCVSAGCGRFYHPKCVALELLKRNDAQMEELERKIAAGDSFTCPAHKCFVCKQVESRKFKEMQFAICRRCPKSYHRKCLPREITFENDVEMKILPRAWDKLLPKRILIYCLDHEINPELGTPLRNHICFPGPGNDKQHVSEQELACANHLQKKRKPIPYHPSTEGVVGKTVKQGEVNFSSRDIGSAMLPGKGICRTGFDDERKANCSKLTSTSRGLKSIFPKVYASSPGTVGKSMLEDREVSAGNANISCKRLKTVGLARPLITKKGRSSPVVDLEMKRRINALIEDADSSFNVGEIKKQLKVPSTYKSSQDLLDKNLTKGKVEVTVKAIRTALQKLDNGGTIDDAKAVCSPEMLRQLPLWKRKLDVYLGPFLHGMRYQSYGRHFTNLEKLQEVVDRLHWYVQDNDTIVDFCCGANDFSLLMKEKLDSVGKKCWFKNYDLFPSKNDFNFEQRDWFTVKPEELPTGSRLIMGLNPPFGVKGALANKFINHALKFGPKILVLIVPIQTKRLDTRTYGKKYDLIWEDRHLLSGKSFYLPGSIDIDDKRMSQWNNIAPPLSLWSRPDWTRKHREIAIKCNHIWLPVQPQSSQPSKWNYLTEEQPDYYGDFPGIMNQYGHIHSMMDYIPGPHGGHEFGAYNRDFVMNNANINLVGQMGRDVTNSFSWERENATNFAPLADLSDMDISPS